MKKILYLFCALIATMSFVSCGGDDDNPSGSGEITGSDITLTISKSSLQFDAEGGTQIINITSNAMYAGAESYVEWIHFKMNGAQLQVIVEPNTSTEERTSKIMISVGATADFREKNQKQNYAYATVTQKGASNGGSSIKGPKWVLVGYEAPTFTQEDIKIANANTVYKVDSLKMEATKTNCSGFFSETVFNPGGPWNGGSYLFCFDISQIPQELEGGSTITLYYKASLPRHYGANDNNDDYAEWAYFHCFCYVDCRIDDNKIRSKEEDFSKFNGYNLPIVCMNDNQPDLFAAEGYIYGNVPQGKKAGDRINLTIDAVGLGANGKYLYSTYTYEWRE